jgi:hypothetical protein
LDVVLRQASDDFEDSAFTAESHGAEAEARYENSGVS